jgi:hypothetical protein
MDRPFVHGDTLNPANGNRCGDPREQSEIGSQIGASLPQRKAMETDQSPAD